MASPDDLLEGTLTVCVYELALMTVPVTVRLDAPNDDAPGVLSVEGADPHRALVEQKITHGVDRRGRTVGDTPTPRQLAQVFAMPYWDGRGVRLVQTGSMPLREGLRITFECHPGHLAFELKNMMEFGVPTHLVASGIHWGGAENVYAAGRRQLDEWDWLTEGDEAGAEALVEAFARTLVKGEWSVEALLGRLGLLDFDALPTFVEVSRAFITAFREVPGLLNRAEQARRILATFTEALGHASPGASDIARGRRRGLRSGVIPIERIVSGALRDVLRSVHFVRHPEWTTRERQRAHLRAGWADVECLLEQEPEAVIWECVRSTVASWCTSEADPRVEPATAELVAALRRWHGQVDRHDVVNSADRIVRIPRPVRELFDPVVDVPLVPSPLQHGPFSPEAHIPEEVLRDPLANGPRRSFADRIGGERAMAIRMGLQTVAYERWETAERPGLDALEGILARRAEDWLGPLAREGFEWRWARGFPEDLTIRLETLLDDGDWVFRHAPVLCLRLRAARPWLGELLSAPWLARIRALDLGGQRLTDDDVARMVERLGHLVYLDLRGNQITERGLDLLAAGLPHVVHLDLYGNPCPQVGPRVQRYWQGDMEWLSPVEATSLVERHGALRWVDPPPSRTPFVLPWMLYQYSDPLLS